MQFKQSLLAAVFFAVFAVAAPAINVDLLGCPSAGAPPAGEPSAPTDGSIAVSVPVNVGGGDLLGSAPGGVLSALPIGGLPVGGLPVAGGDPGVGGIAGGLPGIGGILGGGDGGLPGVPGVSDPTGSPTWGTGAPSGPSASAGVSAPLGAPSAPTSVLPISTNLATSVSAPTATLPVSTNHVTSASAPQPTPAPSNPGSPNSPEQPSGSNSGGYGGGSSTCSTGPVQCCDSVQKSDAPEVQNALGLLNIPIGGVTGLVGLTCSPILGTLSSSSCSAQTVCCEDNSYGSLVSIGCLPITL